MADIDPVITPRKKRVARDAAIREPITAQRRAMIAGQRALKEAKLAGLLDSQSEHVSFRAPKALVDAAKREAGIASTTELGVTALAMLAQVDPFAEFFSRTEGALGPDHDLEY